MARYSAEKTHHVLYFLKVDASMISDMILIGIAWRLLGDNFGTTWGQLWDTLGTTTSTRTSTTTRTTPIITSNTPVPPLVPPLVLTLVQFIVPSRVPPPVPPLIQPRQPLKISAVLHASLVPIIFIFERGMHFDCQAMHATQKKCERNQLFNRSQLEEMQQKKARPKHFPQKYKCVGLIFEMKKISFFYQTQKNF